MMTTPWLPPPSSRKKTRKKRSNLAFNKQSGHASSCPISFLPALHYLSMKITRRIPAFLVLIVPIYLFLRTETASPRAERHHYLALVGTYTSKTQSKGIYAYDFDADTGKLAAKGIAVETPDPSWVAIHPSGKFAYAVNEAGKKSTVSAFALDAQTGKLTLLNQLPSLGEDPCYLSFDQAGKFLLVANYTSGTVAVFPILSNGKLAENIALVNDSGKLGPNKERQESPHAHWVQVSEHNHFAYVADLGLDRILIYRFDASAGTLVPGDMPAPKAPPGVAVPSGPFSATLSPGTGPRHAAFSADGKFMYVVGEMKSTVTVFANDAARQSFSAIQEVSALPPGFSGRNDAAEIALHPSGKWLYTSNRGNDTIAVFAVNPTNGTVRLLADVASGGKEPRHFAIDPTGQFLLAENQNSDSVVEFRIDVASGALTPTSEVAAVPAPVCLVFQPVR
jgi:6-phosphogluconolactonase